MVSPELAGLKLPECTYLVEAGRIEDYAEAMEDTNPLYRSSNPEMVAPPTFAAAFYSLPYRKFIREEPDLLGKWGIDVARIVHGDQGFRFYRSFRPGDRLTIQGSVSKIDPKGDLTVIEIETAALNQAGETIVEARITLIQRER